MQAAQGRPSGSSQQRNAVFPSAQQAAGPDAFDAIVQAANPAHPAHAAWKERYGGSMRAMRKSTEVMAPDDEESHGIASAEGSFRRQRSKTGHRSITSPRSRPSLDGAALRGRGRSMAEPISNGSPMTVSSSHVGSINDSSPQVVNTDGESKFANSLPSNDDPRPRRRKRKDKGKGKAGPPPVPPPRTTSHLMYQQAALNSPTTSQDGTAFSLEGDRAQDAVSMSRRASSSAPTSPNPALVSTIPFQLNSLTARSHAPALEGRPRNFRDMHFVDVGAPRQRGKSFDVSRADFTSGYNARDAVPPSRLLSKGGDGHLDDGVGMGARVFPGRQSIDFRLPEVPVESHKGSKKGFEALFASLRGGTSKHSSPRSEKQPEAGNNGDNSKSSITPILRYVPGRASMSENRRQNPPPPPPRSPLRPQAQTLLDDVREEKREESLRDADGGLRSERPDKSLQVQERDADVARTDITAKAADHSTSKPVEAMEESGAAGDVASDRISHSHSISVSIRSEGTEDFHDARSFIGTGEGSGLPSSRLGTSDALADGPGATRGLFNGSTPEGSHKTLPKLPGNADKDDALARIGMSNTFPTNRSLNNSLQNRGIPPAMEDQDSERTPRMPLSDSGMSFSTTGQTQWRETSIGQSSPAQSSTSQFHSPNGMPNRYYLHQQRSFSRLASATKEGILSRLRRDRTPSQPHLRPSESGDTALSNGSFASEQYPVPTSPSNTSQWADQSTSHSVTGLGIDAVVARLPSSHNGDLDSPRRPSQDGGWRARLPSFSASRSLKSPPSAWHGSRHEVIPPVPRLPSDTAIADAMRDGGLDKSVSRSTSDALASSASHGGLAPPDEAVTIHKTLSPALLTEEHHEADEVGSFIGSDGAEEARTNASKRGTWESFGSYELPPDKSGLTNGSTNPLIGIQDAADEPVEKEQTAEIAPPPRSLSPDRKLLSLTARRASRSSQGSKHSHAPSPLELKQNSAPFAETESPALPEEMPERRRPSFTLRRSKSPMPFPAQSSDAKGAAAPAIADTKRIRNHSLGSTLMPNLASPKPRSSFAADRDRSPVLNQIWADMPPSPSPRSSAVRKFFTGGKTSALRGNRGKGLSNNMLYTPSPPNQASNDGQAEDSSIDRILSPVELGRSASGEGQDEGAARSMTLSTTGGMIDHQTNTLIPSNPFASPCESASVSSSQPLSSVDNHHVSGVAAGLNGPDVRVYRSTGGSVGSSSAAHGAGPGILPKDSSVGSICTGTEGSISSMATTDGPPSSLRSISTRSVSASIAAPSSRVGLGRSATPIGSGGPGSGSSHTAHSGGGGADRETFDRMLRTRAKEDAARFREIAQRSAAPPTPSSAKSIPSAHPPATSSPTSVASALHENPTAA